MPELSTTSPSATDPNVLHWAYLTEHWRDVALSISTAPAGIKWRDIASLAVPIVVPVAISVIVSLAVNQERDSAMERRIMVIEREIEPGMLRVTKAELEGMKVRVTQIESRHDEIMRMIIHAGSGYTYYPDSGKPK